MTRRTVLALSLLLLPGLQGCGGLNFMRRPMEGEAAITTPPAGKTLVNFHRPSGWGGGADFPVFDRETLIGNVGGSCMLQYVCDPGEHVFLGTADSTSVIRADLAPDQVYDIVVNIGFGVFKANITLDPITKDHEKRAEVSSWEARENLMIFVDDEKSRNYESRRRDHTRVALQDFLAGEKQDRVRVLGRDDHR
jgi:hypothetical protein